MAKRYTLLVVGVLMMGCNAVSLFSGWHHARHQDTTTYRNQQYDFEIDYPADWFLTNGPAIVILTSFELGSLPQTHGIPLEHTKIDIVLPMSRYDMPFEDYVIREMQELGCIIGDPVVFPLAGGGEAVEIVTMGYMSGDHTITYVQVGEQFVQFVAFSNLTPVRGIIRSLRTTESADANDDSISIDRLMAGKPEPCDASTFTY